MSHFLTSKLSPYIFSLLFSFSSVGLTVCNFFNILDLVNMAAFFSFAIEMSILTGIHILMDFLSEVYYIHSMDMASYTIVGGVPWGDYVNPLFKFPITWFFNYFGGRDPSRICIERARDRYKKVFTKLLRQKTAKLYSVFFH